MRVLMLNTFDETGGAARSALRLLTGVRKHTIDAGMLVQFKTGNESAVICSRHPLRKLARHIKVFLGLLPVRLYANNPENNFSPSILPDIKTGDITAINPDIIHLHWLCAGFLRMETLARLNKPLIWTLHDSWAFTGGCHVPFDCTRYRQKCGTCPVLGSSHDNDLSRRTWQRKAKAWQDLDLRVVAPSRWLADCARSSSLFRNARVDVIPHGLDLETFQLMEKKQARHQLGLPQDKKIILFGAVRGTTDPNKGFHLLKPALQILGKGSSDLLAVVFSSFETVETPDLGMLFISLDRIDDDPKLAAVYAAADVFVVPSLQEAFCLTAVEALACGTPVVAFGATGLLDVVDHESCGYLARPYDHEDLAQGIAWVLENPERHARISAMARQKAESAFNLKKMTERYVSLYRELLATR